MKSDSSSTNAQAAFATVRDTPEVVKALAEVAAAEAISSTDAIRQVIKEYLEQPFKFEPERFKTAVWANVRTDQATVDAFAAHAHAHGVSVAEGIRQCVRRFLANQGRKF